MSSPTPLAVELPPPPRWRMENVFPGLQSPEREAAFADIERQTDELERFLETTANAADVQTSPAQLATVLAEAVERLNRLLLLADTTESYLEAFITTDSRDAAAKKLHSAYEQLDVRLEQAAVRLRKWVGSLAPALEEALPRHPVTQTHAFVLREMAEQAHFLMSEAEEALAAELNVSGGNAWGKLQGTVVSQLSVPFEIDGARKELPMPALLNLRSHPDEGVRRRAYEAENQAWEGVKETLAACMNGVKGATITLNKRRGRTDAQHASRDANRIDEQTLDALLGAMHDSLPMWRRYFKAKAHHLGKEQLAWWDFYAPLGASSSSLDWQQARAMVLENFSTFSDDLSGLARRAFDEGWIDAEQRTGKRGGAFCMGVRGVKQSRILVNFDGSLDQVSTLAHELGHAYHNECMFQAGQSPLNSRLPMTVAETASIMCETITMNAVLRRAQSDQEKLAILESRLNGASQVVVDILSRYLFEDEVFARRARSELSAAELNEIMERAQDATYGDGLDARYRQGWMWTWKPHYYSPRLAFYNYPYAFGLLFGTGLYAIYEQQGAAFVPAYRALLADTGTASAAELAGRFGINLRDKGFWANSLAVIGRDIDQFEAIPA